MKLPRVTQLGGRIGGNERLSPGEVSAPSASSSARPTELPTLTPWLAPIVSRNLCAELLRHIYQPLNLTIGLTAFAVGK